MGRGLKWKFLTNYYSELTMKLLLALLGSFLSLSFSSTNLENIIALSEHFQALEPDARNDFVEVAANVISEEAHRAFPVAQAGNRGIDIPGCIDCALKKIMPSAMSCLSNPLGMIPCALTTFDASCLISTCLCSVFTILPTIVLQIFQMIGLCPRAGAAAPAAPAASGRVLGL